MPDEQRVSMLVVGWVALVCAVALLLLFGYFVVSVIPPMTRPTPYFERMSEALASKDGTGKDALSVDLVVLLEYASADIRAFNVQVAFALISGFLLIIVGILLFALGVRDVIATDLRGGDWRIKLTATAPGTVALVLGCVLMMSGILKPTDRKLDTFIQRHGKVGIGTETITVPTIQTEDGGSGSDEPPVRAPQPGDSGV